MPHLLSILEPIALPADLHDVHVMQQPIEERCCECRVLGQRRGPFCVKGRLLVTMFWIGTHAEYDELVG